MTRRSKKKGFRANPHHLRHLYFQVLDYRTPLNGSREAFVRRAADETLLDKLRAQCMPRQKPAKLTLPKEILRQRLNVLRILHHNQELLLRMREHQELRSLIQQRWSGK